MQRADGKPVVMKLIEDGVQRTVPPVALVHEPLPPLPPLVLPPDEPPDEPRDEPREVAVIADVEAVSDANPSPPAPLPEEERGE
jgi:hypothetical protein